MHAAIAGNTSPGSTERLNSSTTYSAPEPASRTSRCGLKRSTREKSSSIAPVSDTAIDVRGAARATCAGPRRSSPDERLSSR